MKKITEAVSDKVAAYISRYDMLRPGMKVLCAVSGGADSMCMLHLLLENSERLRVSVCAAHFNHSLRGEESDRDCAFVQSWCRERKIPFFSEKGDVASYASEHGIGLEEAARKLRYDFLRRACEKLACDRIATAHHLEDNAETVLFHLVRGTGPEGLSGIPPVRDVIVRPLLCLQRQEIEAYLMENGISYVEDSSNASDAYSRNRLRHHVLPELKEINAFYGEAMLRMGELLRQDEACLNSLAEAFISENYDGTFLSASRLCALDRAVSSRVIRLLCPKSLERKHVDAILSAASRTERSVIEVPGAKLVIEQGKIRFGKEKILSLPDTELIPGESVVLTEAGIRVHTEILVYHEKVHGLFKPFSFKCDQIYGRVFLTSRREGDEIRLYGRNCTKSVRKLFAEAGYTQQERAMTPVLRDDRGVLAVVGLGIAERTVPREGDSVYQITVEKWNGGSN